MIDLDEITICYFQLNNKNERGILFKKAALDEIIDEEGDHIVRYNYIYANHSIIRHTTSTNNGKYEAGANTIIVNRIVIPEFDAFLKNDTVDLDNNTSCAVCNNSED